MNALLKSLRRLAAPLGAAVVLAACGGGNDVAVVTPQAASTAHALAVAVSTGPSVTALTKVSETRVGRTLFEYVFKVTVQNGDQPLQAVTAKLLGAGPGTTIIDGESIVGDMAANATATSNDTIKLRQDRTLPFQLALLSWQVGGTPLGPVPAALQLTPAQWVIGAGSTLAVTASVLDSNGQPITPTPAVNLQVAPVADSASGTLPVAAAGQIATAADTRGNYVVTGTVGGVSSQFGFTVIQNATQSKNSGLYVTLSSALAGTEVSLAQVNAALQNNDAAAAAAALAALSAAADAVDPDRMVFSTAYEPDAGFVPAASKLAANGFASTPGDAGYGAATAQLRTKMQQITALLNAPSSDSAANDTAINQYLTDLQAIAATLKTAGATPGVYGVVNHGSQVSDLLAQDMPRLMKAIAARAATELQAQPLSAHRQRALAAAPGRARASQFGIGSLLGALGPIGQLINRMYGDYLNQLQNMAIILGVHGLLDAFVTQNIHVNGVLSGAALLGPYAYHYPDSYIELSPSTSVAQAQGADVYLIGGSAVNALQTFFGSVSPPSNPHSIREIYDYFDSLIDAIRGVGQAYDLAHQQPTSVTAESFTETFGCLPSLSDSCTQLNYANGFENVSGGNVSFTVLILVRTGGPQPQVGSLLTSFAPGT